MSRKPTGRRRPRLDDGPLATVGALGDELDLNDAVITGDFTGADLSSLAFSRCRLDHVALTGCHLLRASLVDCVVVDAELSGAVLEECRFERVEFQRCRLSGVQAQGSRFRDTAMLDCKADGGNFRMTVWESGELCDSNLIESDFYGAQLLDCRIHGCDLSNVELSKATLTGSRMHRSRLDGVRGGDSLRGVTIGSDQIIPVALAIFAAVGVRVDDDPDSVDRPN